MVSAIKRNSMRMSKLISDLLDVAAMEQGKLELNLQTVDISIIAASAAGNQRQNAERKKTTHQTRACARRLCPMRL
jgi:signal transduction histidine kinase